MTPQHVQVAIIGAGPAGLFLAHLLRRKGISCTIFEARSREYIEGRVRAGVLEHGTALLLRELGAGGRMDREGIEHDGVKFRFGGRDHHLDFPSHTGGRRIMVYGQQEVVTDLFDAWLDGGGDLHFSTPVTAIEGAKTETPAVVYTDGTGREQRLNCDFVAACDGFHGVGRRSVPDGALTVFERVYPFAWLGVLAEVEPFSDELVYAHHEDGFALHSLRTPTLSRNYVQVPSGDMPEDWSDERFWEAFTTRMALADGSSDVQRGRIVEKSVAQMRSFVVEPLQYGRLFLAGDAAHIVPATGAKGLNLAVSDVRVLAAGLADFYDNGSEAELLAYSDRCLRKVWRAQHFSWWMTSLLHRFDDDAYASRLQLAELSYLLGSEASRTVLAENYVGWIDPELGF